VVRSLSRVVGTGVIKPLKIVFSHREITEMSRRLGHSILRRFFSAMTSEEITGSDYGVAN
jgi:hypothetical protein